MERLGTLIQKLQQLYTDKADTQQILLTVELLRAELMQNQGRFGESSPSGKVTVIKTTAPSVVSKLNVVPPVQNEEKIIEVLKVDEAEIEAELEDIKRKATMVNKSSLRGRSSAGYKVVQEEKPSIPSPGLHQVPQKEINESINIAPESLNDKLKEEKKEMVDHLKSTPIADLKKAIGINERFVFIDELFRGDEMMYERSIKTINAFPGFQEAQYWMERELKLKLGWDMEKKAVKNLYDLVRRRFL
ncbi:MAG TPA: hypothetical protein VFN30_06510 [Chitinophagaceae bacterium]|nr:hypothetical protein [Chitinophagaceae bacterium]